MKVNNYNSQCTPELNAKVMRNIESLVCDFRDELPNGWRCCVEFQRDNEAEPYYQLDIESNHGGGSFAPVKMQMLRLCPEISATGNTSLALLISALNRAQDEAEDEATAIAIQSLIDHLTSLHSLEDINFGVWTELKTFGITHWYGGVRIPYDILLTEHGKTEQHVQQLKGEIRITFSGAKEWQDTFFCFQIFRRIQMVLNNLWTKDQIWYNLRGFSDPALSFWTKALDLQEAPER